MVEVVRFKATVTADGTVTNTAAIQDVTGRILERSATLHVQPRVWPYHTWLPGILQGWSP